MSTPTINTPRGEARRRAFLDSAMRVFLTQGLAAASVNDVVRLAGGSLATLYAQFGSKEGLFLAVFEEGVDRLIAPLHEVGASDLPVAEGLQLIGERVLRAALQPEGVAIYRIVVAEAHSFPEVANQFQTLLSRLHATLRAYLEERMAAGEVCDIDAEWAATYFIDMVRSRHLFTAILRPDYTLSAEEISANVARAVEFALNGVKAK